MAYSVQYTTTEPAGITSWTLAPEIAPPVTGAKVTCTAVVQGQVYFLGVLDRAYPSDYIAGLKASKNSGYELLQANAKIAARISTSINNFECGSYVITADGGLKSTGFIEIWKTDTSAYTLKRGTRVGTVDGRDFVTTVDQAFDALNLGPFLVPIEAVDVGFEYNTTGELVARNGEIIAGEVAEIRYLVTDPVTFDPSVTIRQINPTSGGRSADLDARARDFGILRNEFESDDEFRLRVTESPDTVSPAAITRGVNRLLRARNPAWSCTLREIGYPNFTGIYYDAGSSSDAPQNPDRNFAWDMIPAFRPSDRFKLLVNSIDSRGFFLVEVPRVNDSRDFGLCYDVSPAAAYPLANAYDAPGLTAKDSAYDGYSTYSGAFYRAIWDLLLSKHAAGVGYNLIQEPL